MGLKIQACVTYYFFVKEARELPTPQPITLEVAEQERSLAEAGDYSWAKDHVTLACHHGVWDEGHPSAFQKLTVR